MLTEPQQIIPGLILGIGAIKLPFSPRWLCSKGHYEEALNVLVKLRQLPASDTLVRNEWMEIRAEVACHEEICKERHPSLQRPSLLNAIRLEVASFIDCFKPGCWRRTHVGVMIMFFQQFVAVNALI